MRNPIVTISTGKIRGKTNKSITNSDFYSFQGIPYAKPPIGSLRFKAPEPAEPWTDVRDATHEGGDSLHRNMVIKNIQGGEDCLYINVYTPDLPGKGNNSSKPVMVWIHGGGFISGSGSSEVYGPEFLMSEDIVLVSFNYRLGILGFLSLEDSDLNIPGNAGLKDMVLALKWVKENISNFSGDPNNVTIFGESAGGGASHLLVLSPMAKGLFHKAIIQSGTALNVWAKGRRNALDVSKILNLQTTDEKKILEKLQKIPAEELFRATENLRDTFIASFVRPHGPVIEKKSTGAFLCENPIDILKSGRYNHVPIMIGFTNREGMLTECYQKPRPFQPLTDFENAIPHFMKLQRGSEISKLVAKEIKEFYYGDEEPSGDNKDAFYKLETDNFFARDLLRAVKLHSVTSTAPVFLYRMSIETDLNMMKKIFGISEPGVCHADDIGYLFNNMLTPEITPGSDEDIGRNRFIKLWTNFAKNSNPNPKEKNPLIPVNWKPVTKTELNFIDIGKKLTVGTNPEAERMMFWDKILDVNPVCKL